MNVPALYSIRARLPVALVLGGRLSSASAVAQVVPPPSATRPETEMPATGAGSNGPAPEAIPGATARAPVAPAGKDVGDLQPTDALFDAINRGDVASARDALNRGADLDGVDILGMTPMELSIDLGRNDISFLLLSMRGEDSDRGARSVGHDAAPAGKSAVGGKPAQSGKAAGSAKTAAKPPVAVHSDTPSKLVANDGGTPLPSAGFLGFGSRATAN